MCLVQGIRRQLLFREVHCGADYLDQNTVFPKTGSPTL